MTVGIVLPPEEERAYFAGYFDAEGCVDVHFNNGTWTSRIAFGQTSPDVLLQLQQTYGGTLRVVERSGRNASQLHWTLRRSRLVTCFLQDIEPYVREKRVQVHAVLKDFAAQMSTNTGERLRATLKAEKRREIDGGTFTDFDRDRTCEYKHCERSHLARGYCRMHYKRLLRQGVLQPLARVFSYMRPPTSIERAYVAGYFDGDGCLSWTRAKKIYLSVSFGQTRPEGVQLMHEIYGGTLRIRRGVGRNRDQVKFLLSDKAAVGVFLQDVLPFVREKRTRVEVAQRYLSGDLSSDETQTVLTTLTHQRYSAEHLRGLITVADKSRS